MNDLEAIDRIRVAAIQSKEKKLEPHMPKQLRLRGSANLDEKKKYFLEKKFSLFEMEADDAPGGSEKEFMVIDTHDDPLDSIPKARKDDLILVANCKEQKERWMQKIGDEIRK